MVCQISSRLSSCTSHGAKNRFLMQQIVIKMRESAIYVRTVFHNIRLKLSQGRDFNIQCLFLGGLIGKQRAYTSIVKIVVNNDSPIRDESELQH